MTERAVSSETGTEGDTDVLPRAGRPRVETVNEAMASLKIGRAGLYELINTGELESYTRGKSRRILTRSIDAYLDRRVHEEEKRRRRP